MMASDYFPRENVQLAIEGMSKSSGFQENNAFIPDFRVTL